MFLVQVNCYWNRDDKLPQGWHLERVVRPGRWYALASSALHRHPVLALRRHHEMGKFLNFNHLRTAPPSRRRPGDLPFERGMGCPELQHQRVGPYNLDGATIIGSRAAWWAASTWTR